MRKHQWTRQSGLSLIEMVIALVGISAVSFLAVDSLTRTQELGKLASNRVAISNIEESLRQAVFDGRSFFETATKSKKLYDCLKKDGNDCPKAREKLAFMLTDEIEITGKYHSNGARCADDECILEVSTEFEAICASGSSCDVARYILVHYKIDFDDTTLKKGTLRRTFTAKDESDVSDSCGIDDFGRTKLAHSLRVDKVDCSDLPELNREVNGIKPGDCQAGIEILAGFDAGGAPVCQPILMTGGGR